MSQASVVVARQFRNAIRLDQGEAVLATGSFDRKPLSSRTRNQLEQELVALMRCRRFGRHRVRSIGRLSLLALREASVVRFEDELVVRSNDVLLEIAVSSRGVVGGES